MSLPEAQTLSKEDFATEAGWIDRLLLPLNRFMAAAAASFRAALVAGENYQLTTMTIDTPAAAANAFPVYFALQMRQRPRSCIVAHIEDKTAGATFSTAVYATWRLQADRVEIRAMTGLSNNTKYSVTFELKA